MRMNTRNDLIWELRKQGYTYKDLSDIFHVCPQRISQIIFSHRFVRFRRARWEFYREVEDAEPLSPKQLNGWLWRNEWRVWLPLLQRKEGPNDHSG